MKQEKEKKDSPIWYGLVSLALAFLFGGLGLAGLKVENGWDITPITITETITERGIDDNIDLRNNTWEENIPGYEKSFTRSIVYDLNTNQRFERIMTTVKDLEKMKQKEHQMWKAVLCRILGIFALFIAVICFIFFIPLVIIWLDKIVIWLDNLSWMKHSDSNESWLVYLVSFFVEFFYKKLILWLV